MPRRLARRALDDEHALVLRDEAPIALTMVWVPPVPGRVLHDERVAGGDLRDHVLLLGVGVEQQGVGRTARGRSGSIGSTGA